MIYLELPVAVPDADIGMMTEVTKMIVKELMCKLKINRHKINKHKITNKNILLSLLFRTSAICICIAMIWGIFGSCLSDFSSVSAEEARYKIPKYEDFRPGKAANDIEKTVNANSVIYVEANQNENKVFINGETAAKEHTEAVEEMNGYIKKLNNNGMYLNRELINIVTVKIKNISLSEYAEIVIDNENLQKIIDLNALKIAFENSSEYIVLDKESINFIAENIKEFKIRIKKLSKAYTINFLDSSGNIIDKYGSDIKVGLPASHPEQTVYLYKNNEQENWGGQYNGAERTMEFMTKFSGEYNVASPEIRISDIDDLTEEEKQAIRFMVVRGYFNTSKENFNPGDSLTRYDFAEALVRMFFALDNDAKCTFSDVDKKHRRYVAASQEGDIVRGFEDGTFKGYENVTAEQVIALTARTISSKNGYVYPENIEKYLNFTDDNIIEDWARKEIALAVREGIYSNSMNLKFSEDISRKDAAVILYRLFMITNNTPEATNIVDYTVKDMAAYETFWNKKTAYVTLGFAAGMNVIAVAVMIVLNRKKKKDDDVDKG